MHLDTGETLNSAGLPLVPVLRANPTSPRVYTPVQIALKATFYQMCQEVEDASFCAKRTEGAVRIAREDCSTSSSCQIMILEIL